MALPKISIVTPSYNQGQFLEETIQSVLEQNYPNLEYIIIDGGSSDNSVDVIKKYESHLTYWVSEKDNGQTHAINKGLRRATGEILTWLNSDDLLLPCAVSMVADFFERYPDAGFVYGDCHVINENGTLFYVSKAVPFERNLLFYGRCLISQPASFFRRNVLDRIGYLDESFDFAMDIELWIRAAQSRIKFDALFYPLAAARVHGKAKTTSERHKMIQQHKIIIARYRKIGFKFLDSTFFITMNLFFRYKCALKRYLIRGDWGLFRTARARAIASHSARK